jgi:IS1 family transposase
MNVLKHEKKLAVVAALVEGSSIRSVSRMTGVSKTTILKLIVDTGTWCERVMDNRMRNVRCAEIEADELWTYIAKKQRRLTPEDRAAGRGDAYTYVAFDPRTKLIPVIRIGKRDVATTHAFMHDLRARLVGRIQLSTDAFTAYNDAVEAAFGPNIDYAQITKHYAQDAVGRARYGPPSIIGVTKERVQGNPRWRGISTSFVEIQNLKFRMQLRRFTRLTNAFSKKLDNLKAMVWVFVAYYNFCRIHGSLRVTPAMAAGLTDHVWDLAELIA